MVIALKEPRFQWDIQARTRQLQDCRTLVIKKEVESPAEQKVKCNIQKGFPELLTSKLKLKG